MIGVRPATTIATLLALGACAVAPPVGPDVMALPAQGKTLAAFQTEDINCRNYAQQTIAPYVDPSAARGVGSAAVGTVVGAAAGAAIGAAAGNPGLGAAIGAGTGLAVGSSAGAANAAAAAGDLQQGYDVAYTQCMYAAGNKVTSPPAGTAVYAEAYPYPYGYYGPGYFPGYFGFGFGGYGGWRGGYYDHGGFGGGYRGGWRR